jgi:hypothetical protein
MVPRGVRGRRTGFYRVPAERSAPIPSLGLPLAIAAVCATLVAAGCGGTRQDAHEASGNFEMELVSATFPVRQAVARPATLLVRVRNSGSRAVPNVAVTVDSFNYISNFAELASRPRPVWAIERGPGASPTRPVETQEVSLPGSAQTAYFNTWALGRLAAGQTQTFRWRVVPVKPGVHTVRFLVSAGLAGKAQARLAAGGPVQGKFVVNIASAPPRTFVNPNTGRVVEGTAPPTP